MTSTIKVNTITTESGSTLTVGGCGKTVALASGASQTGFGRSGSVNWQTTKKTLAFTAVNGEGYFVDTAASGAVTMTLPASPNAGDIVAVKDYNNNFATANLTIDRNGSPINGGSGANVTVNTDGASIVLVYVDATQGWLATQDDSSSISGAAFVTATGGTVTECGSCKIHTFTGPGSFVVSQIASTAANNVVSYVVVGGGGSGGGRYGGGGGAGGYREVKSPVTPYTASPLDGYGTPGNRITVTAGPTSYPVEVGGGGPQPATDTNPNPCGNAMGSKGTNSNFSTIVAAGGGGGAGQGNASAPVQNGGSGGGSSYNLLNVACRAGNTPSVTPPQGNPGGNNGTSGGPPYTTAGGGAAGGPGADSTPSVSGAGGPGVSSSINGTPTARAGGGGGGGSNHVPVGGGAGGAGGGAAGGSTPEGRTCAGTVNTGGGGGGGYGNPGMGGAGGSGIVIIRYKFKS